MVELFIDTRDSKKVLAKLLVNGKSYKKYSTNEGRHPDSVLKLTKEVCDTAGISIQEIDEIWVEEGPGSYTGLKVGVSVANALGFSLQKKVNGKELGELIEPVYE
jgi:tRNA threonylcarbamoyladenosine biosynthesis protein TsaB